MGGHTSQNQPDRASETDRGSILFVGLGAMGSVMSPLLAAAGHDVWLCDVRGDVAKDLAQRIGARTVGRGQLPPGADASLVVILMLPDSQVVEAVLEGDDGLLGSLAPGSLVIDMSSSRPPSTVRLAEKARGLGIAMIDAPVSGGVPRATTGELAIMVGGQEAAVDRAMPVLEALGKHITRVGPAGSGHAVKALNNLLSAIGLAGASEVLSIGTKFGLSPETLLDALNSSTGRNQATEVKMARYVFSGEFDSGFSLNLMIKDLRAALDIADSAHVPAPLSATCLDEWIAARGRLGDAADHTQIAEYAELRAGVKLRSNENRDRREPRFDATS